jgi:hypothetical protein
MSGMRRVLFALALAIVAFTSSAAEAQEAPSTAPLVVMGVGGVGLVFGGVFAGVAAGAYDSAENDPVHESAAGSVNTGDTFTTLSNAMLVIGGSLLLFGIGWTAVEFTRPSRTGATARLDIGPGSLSLSGTFD